MTVSADVNHVQAAAFIFTIDLRLREALLLEELHTFVSLLEHLFTRPEAQRFRLAGLDAGRNAAVVETINAERALVDTAVHRAETRHVERAGRLTERAAVALIGVELHYAALILAERARTSRLSRSPHPCSGSRNADQWTSSPDGTCRPKASHQKS